MFAGDADFSAKHELAAE